MHPCLYIDEIVRVIARELVASGGPATSVALARCCKSLGDPVLDVLWQTQVQLLPLLKSLPRDVWNGRGYTVSPPTIYILSLLNYFKVFPKAPDDGGLYPFPEIRPDDAGALHNMRSALGGALRSATLRRRQTPLSESGMAPAGVSHSGVHPILTLFPFPQNHQLRRLIRIIPPPQRNDRLDDHRLPCTMPQLAGDVCQVPAERSNNRCCCLQDFSRQQLEQPPTPHSGLPAPGRGP